jgi:PAS domain S-box-containing protein
MLDRTDEIKKIKRYKYWILLLWTIVVVASFFIYDWQIKENLISESHLRAQVHYEKDLLYRRWSSLRGGAYVPVDEHTQPNPYLKYVSNRDVTINGKEYTLVNPAYMTRQVYELAKKDSMISSRLVSDNALNPINQADDWENYALQKVRENKEHYDTIFTNNGEKYISVLRPFFTEKSCLKCHEQQGYKVGDLRGGILISIPLNKIEERYDTQENRMILILSVIFFMGFGLIHFGAAKIEKDIIALLKTEKSLSESEAKIETYLSNAPNLVTVVDKNGVVKYLNKLEERAATGLDIDKNLSEFLGEEEKAIMVDILNNPDESIFNRAIEYSVHKAEKVIWYENRIAPIKTENEITGYIIISTDITERKLLSEKIVNSLKEKEVLLKEVHHRVKNNMQIITSLLNLQSSLLTDQRMIDVFKESQNRIKSMALIHEIMYQSGNFSNIDTNHYITSLVSYLHRSYCSDNGNVNVKSDIDKINLKLDIMIPCGIIITELVSNALKYAFPDNLNGEITISLHKSEENEITLMVNDNGIGLAEKPEKNIGLGLQLVETLTRQLDGQLIINEVNRGASFTVSFKN